MACVVRGCKSHSSRSRIENGGKNISYHKFPSDKHLRQRWLTAIQQPSGWIIRKHSRVCSKHFWADNFVCNGSEKWRRLMANAVPSLFLPNKPLVILNPTVDTDEVSVPGHTTTKGSAATSVIIRDTPAHTDKVSDHITTIGSTATSAVIVNSSLDTKACNKCAEKERRINQLRKQCQKLQKISKRRLLKIGSMKQACRRLKKRNVDLNLYLVELLEKEKISKEHLHKLNAVKNNKIIEKYLTKAETGGMSREIDADVKKFAVTLHYLSPRAYDFIRTELKDVLPHPKTIFKLYQRIYCNPGFTIEAIDALKERVAQNGNKPLYGALCINEMAIKKLVEWNGRNYFDYANIGSDLDSDNVLLAKEGFAFMLTSVNGTWKIPVGYFLINSISSKQKASLVKQCLTLLNVCGVTVVALTFDDVATNRAMCGNLGCGIKLGNSFTHDGQKVCLWPNPCHNIKLVRNAFADRRIIFDHQGNKISWHFIQLLNQIQKEEGLSLGTKLKVEHMNFVRQKMIRSATHILSQSVTDALELCKKLALPEFVNCDGTITFIRLFNNLFDIMNSRNMQAQGWKKPTSSFNIEETELFFYAADAYINGLKFDDGTLIINSNRSTGFLGFLTCMKSLMELYKTLISSENSFLKYLSMYQLNRGHIIELFCKFDNNPSACMFHAAYKKLLIDAQFRQFKD